MGLSLPRTGSALGLGVVSGGTDALVAPLSLGPTGPFASIPVGGVIEGIGFLGGSVLQLAAPNAAPDVVDGIVDAGVYGLGRRLTHTLVGMVKGGGGGGGGYNAGALAAAYAAQRALAAGGGGQRPLIGQQTPYANYRLR